MILGMLDVWSVKCDKTRQGKCVGMGVELNELIDNRSGGQGGRVAGWLGDDVVWVYGLVTIYATYGAFVCSTSVKFFLSTTYGSLYIF